MIVDNETKLYIDNAFKEFRATIIRFVQTEVNASLKVEALYDKIKSVEEHSKSIIHSLNYAVRECEVKIKEYTRNASDIEKSQDSAYIGCCASCNKLTLVKCEDCW